MNIVLTRCQGLKSMYVAVAVALVVPAVHAAEPVLEEVIVTAQKREENQQETPISITTFTAETLEQRGITGVTSLGNIVTNLRLVPFAISPETPDLYIRGVGESDSQVSEDPPVAIYLNGVYIARTVGLGLDVADLERIEVLRGPQGTLYGRNTTGGAINFITTKPDDKFGGSQLVGFGNYGAVHTNTMLNLPVTDTFYVRGTLDWNQRDGWVKNSGVGRDFDGYDHVSGRFDMRWKPSDALTVDYSYDRSKSDFTGVYWQIIRPTAAFSFLGSQPNQLTSATLLAPYQGSNNLAWGHTLTASLDTGIGEFKSITAYREDHSYEYNDFSGNPIVSIFLNDHFVLTQHQVSQEFQLAGSTDAKMFDYIAGLYYFKEGATQWEKDVVPIAGPGVATYINVFALNRTYAAYAQLTWRPDAASPWSATVGGRYTKDQRGVTDLGAGPTRIITYVPPNASTEYDNFSPSLVVNYKITEDALLYAKAVSGYKAGGFNLRDVSLQPFFPEKITSYELGWKTEWLEHRLRWNNALFYENYKNIQLDITVPDQPNPALTETKNAGKAKIEGMETELNLAATDALRLQLSYAYLYNKFLQVERDNPRLYRLQNAPPNSVTATVDWDIAQLPFGTLNTTVDYSWRDNSQTSARALVGDGDLLPAYELTDLRLSLTGADWIGKGTNGRVTFWVRNLFNTKYLSDPIGSFNEVHAIQLSDFGTPRTFGIDFKVKY